MENNEMRFSQTIDKSFNFTIYTKKELDKYVDIQHSQQNSNIQNSALQNSLGRDFKSLGFKENYVQKS